MIKIDCGEREARLWHKLFELAAREQNWTLIGARMVELHAAEAGRILSRASPDGDALADARTQPNPVRRLAQLLIAEGFELTAIGVLGTGHTFVKDGVEIDVLAPESLGSRSEKLRTTVPPLHTVEVPGGRQALGRSEIVDVEVHGRRGRIPRPNLLGAILIKARAVDVDDAPDDQRQDLALLLSLVERSDDLVAQIRPTERAWLRARSEVNATDAICWIGMNRELAQRGLATFRVLSGL